MKKVKIAISVDKSLLDLLDGKVDGSVIRSRSQAFELFLKKGLGADNVDKAVILLHRNHHHIALKKIKGKSLIQTQLDFLLSFGVKDVLIVTQHGKDIDKINKECLNRIQKIKIIEEDAKGNANALLKVKKQLSDGNFIVLNGDTFNDFDMNKMIKKHLQTNTLAIMGLITKEKSSKYGSVILDGDYIVEFQEKSLQKNSHIVNAGIYIFKPEIFELFEHAVSLEKDVFPRLARIKQLTGFFTYGEYVHLDE